MRWSVRVNFFPVDNIKAMFIGSIIDDYFLCVKPFKIVNSADVDISGELHKKYLLGIFIQSGRMGIR